MSEPAPTILGSLGTEPMPEGRRAVGHLANARLALTRRKAIDDPLLNRLGLQVARSVAARIGPRVRSAPRPEDPEVAGWLDSLRTDGVVVIERFLPPEVFDAVRAAAEGALAGDVARDHLEQGANRLEVVWRTDLDAERRRTLDGFWADPRLLALASAAERLEVAPGAGRCTIQHLTQHEGEADLEASLHVDTFHPTHKAWLYLTDVTSDDGPLLYHPGSQRLDLAALGAIYRESTGPNAGSRRVGPDEVARRGLPARAVTCPANTLVVADTSGYHGRVQGRPPGSRTALQVEWRPDPFRRPRRLEEDRSVARSSAGG